MLAQVTEYHLSEIDKSLDRFVENSTRAHSDVTVVEKHSNEKIDGQLEDVLMIVGNAKLFLVQLREALQKIEDIIVHLERNE
jgi:hypothetical protein